MTQFIRNFGIRIIKRYLPFNRILDVFFRFFGQFNQNNFYEYNLIKQSGYFDIAWYLDQNSDVAKNRVDPICHYLKHGAQEFRNPGINFDTKFYITDNPEVDFSEINPLVHYIKFGKTNHRDAKDSILAKDYNDRMWGGYSKYAIPLLQDLINNTLTSSRERERAAWYLMRWCFFHEDYEKALELVHISLNMRKPVYRSHYISETQCLVNLNRFEEADKTLNSAIDVFGPHRDFYLLKSLVQPHLDNNESSSNRKKIKLEWINKAITQGDLTPLIEKDDTLPLSFSNITSRATSELNDQQEKVSIIIPVYNASNTISTALESLINQTWKNIEIIVVDDCSTDDTCKIIEKIAYLDNRIFLVKKYKNEGAYISRNVGLTRVSGDFVMVHDSDDWSHPQKIELQINEFRENDQYMAVMSHWIRFDENLSVVGPWIQRGDLSDLNFSSLMVKSHVFDELGNWPEVRVSGDTEYRFRIARFYGFDSIYKIPPDMILSLSLTRENSLTRTKATHMKTLYYGIRWLYRDIYNYWHTLEEFRINPKKHMKNAPVPIGLQSDRSKKTSYYLVVICDYSIGFDKYGLILKTIAKLQESGMQVAIFHWKEFGENIHASIEGTVFKACQKYNIDILSPSDTLDSKFIVFVNASILQYIPDEIPSITAQHLIIGKNKIQKNGSILDTKSTFYQIANTNAQDLFRLEGEWMSLSEWNNFLLPKSSHDGIK